jgi:hypothetical protein
LRLWTTATCGCAPRKWTEIHINGTVATASAAPLTRNGRNFDRRPRDANDVARRPIAVSDALGNPITADELRVSDNGMNHVLRTSANHRDILKRYGPSCVLWPGTDIPNRLAQSKMDKH